MKNSQGKEHCLICPPPSNSPTSPSLALSSPLPPPSPTFYHSRFFNHWPESGPDNWRVKGQGEVSGARLGVDPFSQRASSGSDTTLTQHCLPFLFSLVFVPPLHSPLSLSLCPFPFSFSLSPLFSVILSSCHRHVKHLSQVTSHTSTGWHITLLPTMRHQTAHTLIPHRQLSISLLCKFE